MLLLNYYLRYSAMVEELGNYFVLGPDICNVFSSFGPKSENEFSHAHLGVECCNSVFILICPNSSDQI